MNVNTANELYRSTDAIFQNYGCSSIYQSNKEIYMTAFEDKIDNKNPICLMIFKRKIIDPIKYIENNKWLTFAIRIEVTNYFGSLNEDDPDMYIGGAVTYRLKVEADYFKNHWDGSETMLMNDFSKNRAAHLSDRLLDTCKALRLVKDYTALSKYYYCMNIGKRLSINFKSDMFTFDTTK